MIYLFFEVSDIFHANIFRKKMNLGKSALFADGRLPEYQENSYSQTSTWPMVTVSEYGTLCLDYGLVAALVSINREKRERRGMVRRDTSSATAMTD